MKITRSKLLNAYSCGSPIRTTVIQAIAIGSHAHNIDFSANPQYLNGDSIIWGLIRGAKELMYLTRQNGYDFYQIDNAYFGRDLFFRITRNELQCTKLKNNSDFSRLENIFKYLNYEIKPWNTNRNGPIIICPSSNFLYSFYDTTLEKWISTTLDLIRKHTDRPIKIRHKDLSLTTNIDNEIFNAWCVVTHVSSAGLDALRLGVPVVTTGICAASPLGTPINNIDNPELKDGRYELFSNLAWSQYTLDEFSKYNLILKLQNENA